jgi:hypothetical protein
MSTGISLGVDLGLKQHSWAEMPGGGVGEWDAVTLSGLVARASLPVNLIAIDWPAPQGWERGGTNTYATLAQRATALVVALRCFWPGVPLYGVPAVVWRYDVTGWSARGNCGSADTWVRKWLVTRGYKCGRGTLLNSVDRRDALILALWGQAVLAGKIEQLQRRLVGAASSRPLDGGKMPPLPESTP